MFGLFSWQMNRNCKEAPSKILENKSKRNGFRSAIYDLNGDCYVGEWRNDKKHGKGVQKWISGLSYRGEWKNGRRNGHGVLSQQIINKTTRIYVGFWENDKRNGFGVNFYPDGGVYEGHWSKGHRHGEGRMLYSDGSVYQGQWVLDNRQGFGILTLPNGDTFKGNWIKDGQGKSADCGGEIPFFNFLVMGLIVRVYKLPGLSVKVRETLKTGQNL